MNVESIKCSFDLNSFRCFGLNVCLWGSVYIKLRMYQDIYTDVVLDMVEGSRPLPYLSQKRSFIYLETQITIM